jgi:hypothetical protein
MDAGVNIDGSPGGDIGIHRGADVEAGVIRMSTFRGKSPGVKNYFHLLLLIVES